MHRTRVGAIALAAIVGVVLADQALAGAAPQHQTVTAVGAVISRHGTKAVSVYKITSSLYGAGAATQVAKIKGTTFPLTATDLTHSYYTNGLAITKDTATVGVPNASGVSTVTGKGKCVGGTGIHKLQKCTFKLTGTYNTKTTITHVTATGTVSG